MIPRQRTRVLCVEDSAALLKMLLATVEAAGFAADGARDGAEAVAKLTANPQRFQLVITDIRMPRLDGFGVIEGARSAGHAGPFLVYSGSLTSQDRQRLADLRVSRTLDRCPS